MIISDSSLSFSASIFGIDEYCTASLLASSSFLPLVSLKIEMPTVTRKMTPEATSYIQVKVSLNSRLSKMKA